MAHKSESKYALLTCEQRKAVLDMLEQPGSGFRKVAAIMVCYTERRDTSSYRDIPSYWNTLAKSPRCPGKRE